MTRDEDIVLPRGVRIPLSELSFQFSRSSGPGGQNVNKVHSRVTLRLDVRNTPCLDDAVREILLRALASRINTDGELVLHASEHRDRERNRAAAIERLRSLLEQALRVPKKRRKTRPSRASVERRIREARRRSEIKRKRRPPRPDGD